MFDGESKTNFTGCDKKQIDKKNFNLVDDLQKTANISMVSGKSAATIHQDQRRKNFDDVVQNIDDAFLNAEGPKDPYAYIDKRTQKIEINNGVSYKSTS
jgi:hypothetical protein